MFVDSDESVAIDPCVLRLWIMIPQSIENVGLIRRPYTGSLGKQVVLENTPDRADAVFPADLLAFFVGSPAVADTHFKNTTSLACHLGGDFRLKAEAVFLDVDALNDLAFKDLVTGFHVGEIQIREHVREHGQEGVPHAVIADNATGHYIQRGEIDMVIVGSDRIAMNGDVANKIGTYTSALAAKAKGIPIASAAETDINETIILSKVASQK